MGCSISKNIDSPSKQDTSSSSSAAASVCGNVLKKKSQHAVHDDRSLMTSEASYAVTILSTSYGCHNKFGCPVKSSDKDWELGSQGRYPCCREKVDARSNMHSDTMMSTDVVLGLPVISTESIPELVHKTINKREENFESVNILEVMEGFAEEEVASNFQALYETHGPATMSVHVREKQVDDARTSIRVTAKHNLARRQRPKSFSSINSPPDAEMEVTARNSKTPPPPWEKGLGKVRSDDEEACTLGGTLSGNLIFSKDTGIDTKRPATPEEADPSCSLHRPDNLHQRALSFKYMLNDVSHERLELLMHGSTSNGAHILEDNARISSNESLVLGGEAHSDPSSPEFSVAASLKDWLPSRTTPTLMLPDDVEGRLGTPILEDPQNVGLRTPVPHLVRKCRKLPPKYLGGLSCHSQVETEALAMDRKGFDAPMFDPDLLATFEKAMKHLSKEEWDAVRVMEDSPRNFLQLVKTLGKSSSSSMRQPAFSMNTNNKANTENLLGKARTDPSIHAQPNDGKSMKSLSPEERVHIPRQNSLNVSKTHGKPMTGENDEKVSLVFYSTTAQRDGRLFEECNQVRDSLRSLVGAAYEERSVSECLEYEQELMDALDVRAVVVPTLYVRGVYVVGVDSIVQLYKKELLCSMLKDMDKVNTSCLCRGGPSPTS